MTIRAGAHRHYQTKCYFAVGMAPTPGGGARRAKTHRAGWVGVDAGPGWRTGSVRGVNGWRDSNQRQGRDALGPFLQTFAKFLSTVTAGKVADSLGGSVSDVDKAHLTGPFAESIAALFRVGLAVGMEGWCDDDLAFVTDWGFDMRDCRNVVIWRGAEDRMVPEAHGRWLTDHIRGVRRRLFADQGHLSIALGAFDRILDDLLDPARTP
jgi:hypothetical protein